MSVLPLTFYGDPVLQSVALPVPRVTETIRKLAADMCETMYAAPGRGLAGPQVGQSLRIFVMDCHWKNGTAPRPMVMINPEILDQSAETCEFEEGCLSIPGVLVPLTRPAEVTLKWIDLEEDEHVQRFDGFEAVCVQHEYDHLEGILTLDRLPPKTRADYEAKLMAQSL